MGKYLLAFVMLMGVACAEKEPTTEQKLVGNWWSGTIEDHVRWEVRSNGTMTTTIKMAGVLGSWNGKFTWSVLGDKLYVTDDNGRSTYIIHALSDSGLEVQLVTDEGMELANPMVFTRVAR